MQVDWVGVKVVLEVIFFAVVVLPIILGLTIALVNVLWPRQ